MAFATSFQVREKKGQKEGKRKLKGLGDTTCRHCQQCMLQGR